MHYPKPLVNSRLIVSYQKEHPVIMATISSSKSWRKATPEEHQHKRSALTKDFFIFASIICAMFYFSQFSADLTAEHAAIAFTSNQKIMSCLVTLLMFITFASDLFGLPPPTKAQPKWNTISIIGHCGFFTLQTLFLQTAFTIVKAYAIVSENTKLLVLVSSLALWVNTQGTALTLLFFKLNWYEPKWQRDVQRPMELIYPGISSIWLLGHVPSLPLALFDALFLNDRSIVALHGAAYQTIVMVAFGYGAVYLLFAKTVQWRMNTLIYPFIKDISSLVKGFGFVVVVGFAVSGMGYVLDMFMRF